MRYYASESEAKRVGGRRNYPIYIFGKGWYLKRRSGSYGV